MERVVHNSNLTSAFLYDDDHASIAAQMLYAYFPCAHGFVKIKDMYPRAKIS